jgi:hypothetical protein
MAHHAQAFDFSVRTMLAEALRCLRKSERDLGIDLVRSAAGVAVREAGQRAGGC